MIHDTMANQDTGEPDDEQWPSKLWKAININMNKNELLDARMNTIENAMEDTGRRNADIHRKLETITTKLELVLINQEKSSIRIDQNRKEIERLWAFPLKITAVIVAIGGASAVVFRLVTWLMSNSHIEKIPRP